MGENIKNYKEVVDLLTKLAKESGYKLSFTDVDIDLVDKTLTIIGNKNTPD